MKYLFFFFSFIITIAINAQDKNLYDTKTFPANGISKLEVATFGGNIDVKGAAIGEAKIEIYIKGNNGKPLTASEIESRLKDYTLETGVNGGTLYARAERKLNLNNWKNALSISFKLLVPENIASQLKTSGGNIAIANVKGNQQFKTSGGNIDVKNITGNIEGKTSGGNIEADKCIGETINLRTSGGNISLEDMKADVTVNTSGGHIEAENISGNLNAETSGGNIELDGTFGNINATTSGGNIEVEIEKLDKRASFKTSGGNVKLELPQAQGLTFDVRGGSVSVGAANNIQVDAKKTYAKGTINGGGAKVDASTSGGSVRLEFK